MPAGNCHEYTDGLVSQRSSRKHHQYYGCAKSKTIHQGRRQIMICSVGSALAEI